MNPGISAEADAATTLRARFVITQKRQLTE
jgi:hypothetical protein